MRMKGGSFFGEKNCEVKGEKRSVNLCQNTCLRSGFDLNFTQNPASILNGNLTLAV